MAHLIAFPSPKRPKPRPRLMALAAAAAYCGLGTALFLGLCPRRAIKTQADSGTIRYDRDELDLWLAETWAEVDRTGSWQSWIAVMEGQQS